MSSTEFHERLQRGGLHAAMNWLNRQVPYRYSAIFAFEGDVLRNVCLVDKRDVEVKRGGDQPITDSYCIYIHRTHERFGVEESLTDSRVEGHPKQKGFRCYYGVPLTDAEGKLRGTVCHFDVAPVRLTETVVTLLDDLAPVIAQAVFPSSEKTTA